MCLLFSCGQLISEDMDDLSSEISGLWINWRFLFYCESLVLTDSSLLLLCSPRSPKVHREARVGASGRWDWHSWYQQLRSGRLSLCITNHWFMTHLVQRVTDDCTNSDTLMSAVQCSTLPSTVLFYDNCLRQLMSTKLQWCAESLKGRRLLTCSCLKRWV